MKKVIITTGVIAIAGGVATALLTPSCGECDPTLNGNPSLIVSFRAEDGHAVGIDAAAGDSVTVEWTDEATGKPVTGKVECGNEDCSEVLLGSGQPGSYTIRASVCGSPYEKQVVLDVNDKGCVVDTELIDMPVSTAACVNLRPPEAPAPAVDPAQDELAAKTCTLEARPSVIAPIWAQYGDMMVPVPADAVFYAWSGEPNGRELEGTCVNEQCTAFAAGLEQTGEFVLRAEVCGKSWRTSTSVGKTADGCHVETSHAAIIVNPEECDKPLDIKAPELPEGQTCVPQIWPSAYVLPVTDGGDVWLPQPTANLMYINDGERNPGYCLQPAAGGKCQTWITGFNRVGRFQAFTESCDIETSVYYSVEPSADNCHPKTAFVPVFVDTRGCILAATPDGGDDSPEPAVPTADEVKPG